MSKAGPKLNWQFSQIFGDENTEKECTDEDVISAIQFDRSGEYLSLGDKAGRLIIFQVSNSPKTATGKFWEYQYFTELQSHIREFDYLKSQDIEEKINQIQWLRNHGKHLRIASTNDRTIKLWKISEKTVKKIEKPTVIKGNQITLPKLKSMETGFMPSLKNEYANLHTYHINSISLASNDEFMISSDDLRVYLWNVEDKSKAFNVVDLKPVDLTDLSEVITSSQYHPISDNMFLYSTSKGVVNIADLRKNSVCDTNAMVLFETEDPSKKNFFTEIVSSISDATFSKNGRYIYSRDFLTVKIWDLNMTSKPVCTIPIFEPLKSKLCELYENECIFDKFTITSSPDSSFFVTGNFNKTFHVIDYLGEKNTQFKLNFQKKLDFKEIPKKYYENLTDKYDFQRKVLKTCFHPESNCFALAALNCLYFYNA